MQNLSTLKNWFACLVAAGLMLLAATFVFSGSVSAQNKGDLCAGANLSLSQEKGSEERKCNKDGRPGTTFENFIGSVVNILTIIVGIVAVIMIIIGGFKYITSGGDSGNVTSAKNTILYAIVGLIIIALAQFIVRFVLSKASGASEAGETTSLLVAALLK